MLTDNYLVLCENTYPQVPTHFCRLEFSVKSELLFQTIRDLRVFIFIYLEELTSV